MTKIKNGRVLSVLLALVLVLGTMCAVPVAATDVSALNEAVATTDVTYNISSAADLVTLQNDVAALSAGSASSPSVLNATVNLMNNIDMSGTEWTGIGVPQQFKGFSGTFNGNGYTISGISLTNSSNVGPKGGLFNLAVNAEVTNLTLEGSVNSNRFIGGLAGRVMGNFSVTNCDIDMSLTLNNGAANSVGGVIGQCGSGSGGGSGTGSGGTSGNTQGTVTITNCNVDGTFSSNNNPVGGVIGHIYAGYAVEISGTTVSPSLSGTVAGIFIANNASDSVEIENCTIADSLLSLDIAGVNTGTIVFDGEEI